MDALNLLPKSGIPAPNKTGHYDKNFAEKQRGETKVSQFIRHTELQNPCFPAEDRGVFYFGGRQHAGLHDLNHVCAVGGHLYGIEHKKIFADSNRNVAEGIYPEGSACRRN